MGRLNGARCSPRCRMLGGDQAGFTLVEVMAAMVVFIMVSTATVVVVVQGLKTARENSDRVMAANMARWQLDYWRSIGPASIPVGLTVGLPAGADLAGVLDPRFTVRTTANWVGIGQASSACIAATPQQSYMRVSVTAQSANMVGPVELDSLIYAQPTSTANNVGSVVIAVTDQIGAPVSDVQVVGTDAIHVANNFSLKTGSDGCLYIPDRVAPGTMTVTIARSGFVSATPTGTQGSVALNIGQASRLRFDYAAAAAVQFTSGESGYQYPSALPVSWQMNTTGASLNASTVGTALTGLWPASVGLTAWANVCTSPHTLVSLSAGGTTLSVIPAARVRLRGLPKDAAVTGTCGATTIPLGRTDNVGVLTVGLPYGLWSFTSSGETQTLTEPLAAPPADKPDKVTKVSFTVANLDGESPSPSPSPSPSGAATGPPGPAPTGTP